MAEIKDFARMCMAYEFCSACPLGKAKNVHSIVCQRFLYEKTDEADRIITEWCKEHPEKTYLQDFLEKFPGAGLKDDGLPLACRADLYGTCKCIVCKDCWNEVMPDA